jgi:hypothetical protein
VRELRQSSERSVGTDEETDFMRVFTRDLENIADILMFFVPSEAVILKGNDDQNPCPDHGKWSVVDPGLAQYIFGRLMFVSSDESSLVRNACGENDHGQDGSGGRSLVDMLVGSIKRCDVATGLVPVNRCYFEAEGRGLAHVMRVAPTCCVYFVLRKTECVAFGQICKIYVDNLERGD